MDTKELENFFSDPMVSAHIESFMDAHCSIFTCEKEIHSEHYATHKEFSEMMKSLLNSSSIHYNQIQEMYTTYKTTEDDPSFSSISYIIALWNFELFYQLMTLVNVDLQLEALHYIQQKYGNQFIQMYSNNNNHDSLGNNSTEINENELTDMLLEKSQQKNGMVKSDSNTFRDIPTKNLTNSTIPHEIKLTSSDTVTPSSSSSSWNHILNFNNSETIHQQKYDNTLRPTKDELVEKQAFLRKQRDLLIEMRQKKREKLFSDHVQTLTDNSSVYTNNRDRNSIDKEEHDKVMEKRPFIEFILLVFFYPSTESCKPNADGQFTSLELGSASNVTAVVGSDIYFICCGGLRWTYEVEDDYTSREIGPHPYASIGSSKSPPDLNFDDNLSPSSSSNMKDSTNLQNTVPTTVYTMHDDKGRLILRIDNVDVQDMGHYKCHGHTTSLDAYLVVVDKNYPEEPHNKTLPNVGSMLPHYMMFSSDQLNNVKLICPLVGKQKVKSWLWREPVLPSSTEYAQLPQGRPPSRTVTAIKPGLHEGKHVEIGSDLSWARIVDPLSPEAPIKLWCQFTMPSPWVNKNMTLFYLGIEFGDKEFNFEEINQNLSKSILSNQQLINQDQHATIAHSINAQIDESIKLANLKNTNKSILLENKPARIACRFRSIPLTGIPNPQSNSLRIQNVYWYRNGQSVHVPPFYVDNSLITPYGLSILSVRAYPTIFNFSQIGDEKSSTVTAVGSSDKYKLPIEHLTCSVISRVKETPIYKVTTNASLQTEIILVPRIIHTELLSAERSLEDAIKLTCTAIANGPPNMRIDFASTDQPSTNNGPTQWESLKSRYGLNIRPRQVDPTNPLIHRLVIDISDLKRSDHGVYRCTVWNQAGEAQAIGHVLVHSEPQLELMSFGYNYFLGHKPWKASCVVKGYPLAGQYTNNSQINQHKNREQSIETNDSIITGKQTVDKDSGIRGLGHTDHNQQSNSNSVTSSIRMKIFNIEGEPLDRVEINQIDYKSGKFTG
ncbi:uncharacterized protein DC041_0009499 [Schistosoma bovis]|uniref:Cilia- and flagella-associated protein 36 n=1 Tax=Schistosoma bovis TaxID=6184 RepID=A0A430QCM2_SCHBO|nr:uncharacterized protein DC041_0009499 [Schistosoma bovis]